MSKVSCKTVRIILGHRSAAITEVYAELDQQKAMEAIVRVGQKIIKPSTDENNATR